MEGSRQEIQPTWKLWTKWDCLTNSLANHIGIDPTVFQLRSSPVSEPPESLGFLSTSHQFSLLGPATNLSLLQMPVVWFVWPQCTLVCLDSCPLSWWCYLIISSFATPFSFCLQSFPDSGSFPISQLFASGGQSIGASVAVLPMNIQGWFPLGSTGLFSLQSKGLLRVFSIGSCLVSVSQNVIVFGPRLYKEIIKLQWGH